MICYLDRTFCGSDCINEGCPRNYTKEHERMAHEWAEGWCDGAVPVMFGDYSTDCDCYIPCPGVKKAPANGGS